MRKNEFHLMTMMRTQLLIVTATVILADLGLAQNVAETREYVCARKSAKNTKSECQLRFGELSAINDNGCFMHFDADKKVSVELCPLQCQRFNEARILKTSDSLICSPGVGVGVERRQSDWFMWRSGACHSSDVIFQLECSMTTLKEEELIVEDSAVQPESLPTMEEDLTLKLENGPIDNNIGDENEGISSSIEDITSLSQDTTTIIPSTEIPAKKAEITAESEDDLPEKVDTLLSFMFPSYRKKTA